MFIKYIHITRNLYMCMCVRIILYKLNDVRNQKILLHALKKDLPVLILFFIYFFLINFQFF